MPVPKKNHHSTAARTQPAPQTPATRRHLGGNTQIGPMNLKMEEGGLRERKRDGSALGVRSDRKTGGQSVDVVPDCEREHAR